MILHAAIVLKMVPVRLLQTVQMVRHSVCYLTWLLPFGDTLHKLGSLYASLVFFKQQNLG